MAQLGLTDKPVGSINQESLGVSDYVFALSSFVKTCQTPMTIAIQADWGAGKTSMMNLVLEDLSKSKTKIHTIWFNTWQFSQFNMGDDLPISLLNQFIKRVAGNDGDEVIQKLSRFTKKAGSLFAKAALGKAANRVVASGAKVVDSIFSDDLDESEQIVKLKQELESIVQKKLERENYDRVVVFIDDLDRLVPLKAVELLETMKLFLDISQCVFILAVDYNVILKGLEKKFGTGGNELKGKNFFDKIIQLPFNLPVAQYDIKKYFKDLLSKDFIHSDKDIEIFVRLANSSVGFNPRSMKRLFNSLQLLNMVATSKNILKSDLIAKADEKQRILFAILCLQTAYEPLYRFMLKHQSEINQDFFDTLCDIQKLKESPYYLEIQKELQVEDEKDEKVLRFVKFINVMFDSIQLKSDTSVNSQMTLSESEIENFLRFLSFSSITTTDASGLSATNTNFQFKTYMNDFVQKEIFERYEKYLQISNMSKINIFSDINGFGSISLKVGILGLQVNFCVSTNNYESIIVGFDNESGLIFHKRFARDWAKLNLKEHYKNIKYNRRAKYNFLELKEVKLQDELSFEEKLELFKEEVINNFDIILPIFAHYYEKSQKLRASLISFARILFFQIKKEFPSDEGWDVNFANSFDLGSSKTFITHNDWGGNPFYISIESKRSCFGSLCVNLSKNELGKEYEFSDLFDKLKKDFSNGTCDDEYYFSVEVDKKYSNLVQGSIYDLNEKIFISQEQSKELIEFICATLVCFKAYFKEIKSLSLQG